MRATPPIFFPFNRLPIRGRVSHILILGGAIALAAVVSLRPMAAAPDDPNGTTDRTVEVSSSIRITSDPHGRIFLEVRPLPGDGYSHLALRYTDTIDNWQELTKYNQDSSLAANSFYRIPFGLLRNPFRYYVLRRLFPLDRPTENGWEHQVGDGHYPADRESLWRIAEWFTGNGEKFRDLSRANRIADLIIHRGDTIRIPEELLLPLFSSAARVGESGLQFRDEKEGNVAVYRLRAGEALYSSVVIRFTGRLEADEVNEVADQIAKRSSINNVRNIPIGYPIKIPRDLLLEEHLPPADLGRIEHDLRRAEIDSVRARARSGNLKGVYVILDPGHGGIDVGASRRGLRERDYVYDIMCRIKKVLEENTAAEVLLTVKDSKTGVEVSDERKLRRNGDAVILTNPPYHHTDVKLRAVAVNLRWYLSNSYYRDLTRKGVDPEKVVFTSIHADSLHSAVRGTMVYVPGERFRRRTYGHKGKVYMRREEVREKQYVKFSRTERVRSEGLSRKFAEELIREFNRENIAVHEYQPIRDHVIRQKHRWVPAILRANEVPTKILLEVCNLNNPEDNRLLTDPAFRQRIAEAYVQAVVKLYQG